MKELLENPLVLILVRMFVTCLFAYLGTVAANALWHSNTSFAAEHLDDLLNPVTPVIMLGMSLMTPTLMTRSAGVVTILLSLAFVFVHRIPWLFALAIAFGFAVVTFVTMLAWTSQ